MTSPLNARKNPDRGRCFACPFGVFNDICSVLPGFSKIGPAKFEPISCCLRRHEYPKKERGRQRKSGYFFVRNGQLMPLVKRQHTQQKPIQAGRLAMSARCFRKARWFGRPGRFLVARETVWLRAQQEWAKMCGSDSSWWPGMTFSPTYGVFFRLRRERMNLHAAASRVVWSYVFANEQGAAVWWQI